MEAVLRQVVALTENTRHLEWEVLGVERFVFVAGQFISLTHGTHTRAYSIASRPRGDRRFDLCVNRVGDGYFSNLLCDLEAGATIAFTGPTGFFTLQLPVTNDLLFVATGTGIAPIRGMLQETFAHDLAPRNQATLVFGVRHEQTILYRDELESLAREHPSFHFVPVLSRPSPRWRGRTGHVQEHVRELCAGRRDLTAYVCGRRIMVDDVRAILRDEVGLERQQVRSERYD